MNQYLKFFLGSYTDLGGAGIYQGQLNEQTGEISLVPNSVFTENPSFLAVHPTDKYLYCVNEIDNFAKGKTGSVSHLRFR